jgi:hypothetical protein
MCWLQLEILEILRGTGTHCVIWILLTMLAVASFSAWLHRHELRSIRTWTDLFLAVKNLTCLDLFRDFFFFCTMKDRTRIFLCEPCLLQICLLGQRSLADHCEILTPLAPYAKLSLGNLSKRLNYFLACDVKDIALRAFSVKVE